MAKSPEAFRTISEVAEWLDTPAHVLRFWESRFSQIRPVKRAGGRRYYRPSDMRLLWGIRKLLHEDGITIRGVQKILREKGVRYVADLSPEIHASPGDAGDAQLSPPVEAAAPGRDTLAAARAETPAPPPPDAGTGTPPAPIPEEPAEDPADDVPLAPPPPFAPRIRPGRARLAALSPGERAEVLRLAARLRAMRARRDADLGGR